MSGGKFEATAYAYKSPAPNSGISDAKNIVRRGLKPQSGPGIIRAAQRGPLMRVERFCGSVIHTAHSTHTAHATATRHGCRRFLLERFGDHRLRRDEETGNGRCVLQSNAHDLGGINDASAHHVL